MNTKKLDKAFSDYIRNRDLDGEPGTTCITCGKWFKNEDLELGHFISRRHLATRWDEKNVHLQCHQCNRNLQGNLSKYTAVILERYGKAVLLELYRKSKTEMSFTQPEIDELEKHYKSIT